MLANVDPLTWLTIAGVAFVIVILGVTFGPQHSSQGDNPAVNDERFGDQ